jgi:glutamate--cysteine ligase
MQSKSASWLELCTALSSEHKSQLLASSIDEQKLSELESTAKQSHQDAQDIKQADNVPFDAFLDAYVSP